MSYLLNYTKWKAIFESEDKPAEISDVRAKALYAGATPSNTSNESALVQFKKVLSLSYINGQMLETPSTPGASSSAPIDQNKAIFRANGSRVYKIGPKTVKATHYIKIGDIVLNGDSGKSTRLEIKSEDLSSKTVEAAGNGIYALGRVLDARFANKVFGDSPIIIELNKPTPDMVYAHADTNYQTPTGDFGTAALYTFICSKAIIPAADNKDNNVVSATIVRDKPGFDLKAWFNKQAMPNLRNKESETALISINPLDATTFIEQIQNKQLKEWNPTLEGLVNNFIETFFTSFVTTYTERFKQYFKNQLIAAKANPELFTSLYSYLDDWKTSQLANKDAYKSQATLLIKQALNKANKKEGVSRPSAEFGAKTTKGTEGKLGK